MVNIVDIKHRLSATRARLRFARAGGEERRRELLSLLDTVERKFADMQRANQALRVAEAAARDEARQLQDLLQDILRLAESHQANRPALPQAKLEELSQRLNEIAASAARSPCETSPEPDR